VSAMKNAISALAVLTLVLAAGAVAQTPPNPVGPPPLGTPGGAQPPTPMGPPPLGNAPQFQGAPGAAGMPAPGTACPPPPAPPCIAGPAGGPGVANAVSSRVVPIARAAEAWESVQARGQFVAAAKGEIADADVVAVAGGGYRMYVGSMTDHTILSYVSPDGLTWTAERGVRVRDAAFPDVVRLPNGDVRMYFQRAQVIMSALSRDGGMTFADERGVRVPRGFQGQLDRDNVAATTTVQLPDGSWRMYYRAQVLDAAYFNGAKGVVLSATSRDGLTWTSERGVRMDPADLADAGMPATQRFIDGPEAVMGADGRVKLYFWTVGMCEGICVAEAADGLAFQNVQQVLTIADTPGRHQPGDPAILTLPSGEAYMYYGQGPGTAGTFGIWMAKRVR
jgi:hypothetical protein